MLECFWIQDKKKIDTKLSKNSLIEMIEDNLNSSMKKYLWNQERDLRFLHHLKTKKNINKIYHNLYF